jgi:hypothetical protein
MTPMKLNCSTERPVRVLTHGVIPGRRDTLALGISSLEIDEAHT